jgi:hypothetical protein
MQRIKHLDRHVIIFVPTTFPKFCHDMLFPVCSCEITVERTIDFGCTTSGQKCLGWLSNQRAIAFVAARNGTFVTAAADVTEDAAADTAAAH